MHTLLPLPYPKDALSPVISPETVEYHHGKHHAGYVDKLNELVRGGPLAELSLEDLIRHTRGRSSEAPVFNNAAQVWNHDFYWRCLSPRGGGEPRGVLAQAIERAFGGVRTFREQFSHAAAEQFGSGWAWLVVGGDGQLAIETTANAETPMAAGTRCLLTLDVWEHAYYIDYRNARPRYIEAFWKIVDWEFAARQLA